MIALTEQDATCRIARGGETLLECPVAFDPQAARDLLVAINALRDPGGAPIYLRGCDGRTPVWAMLQEHLYWEYLQPFIKYRPILDWLAAHPAEPVETEIAGLRVWLRLVRDEDAAASSLGERLRHAFESLFLIANAAAVGLWGRLRGQRFLLWSLNCVWGNRWIDYRLKDVYAALWEKGVPFVEGFPFPGFKTVVQRLLGSRRLAFYAPNFLRVTPTATQTAEHSEYDWSSCVAMPETFLRPLIARMETMLCNAKLHARELTLLFSIAGIPRIIGIDEHTSYAALLLAARTRGIEAIGLQHGVFHKYSIGWTTPGIPHEFTAGYDRILVWGEFWRDLLSELSTTYTPDRLEPAGFIRPSTISLRRRAAQPAGAPFRILLPYEFLANPEEIAAYVEAFLARGFEVLFKVRFDDTLDTQLRLLPRDRLTLVPELTQEIIESIHVCAGTSTTMMYELYFLNVPSWFIRTRHDSNIHMVDKGIAADITLEKLRAPDFDPAAHLIVPAAGERIFAGGSIPQSVLDLASGEG